MADASGEELERERLRRLLRPFDFAATDAIIRGDRERLGSLLKSKGMGSGSAEGMEAGAGAMWRSLEHDRPQMVKALLAMGYDPNHRRLHADNDTPAMMAAYHGSPMGLRALLDAGADPMALDDYGGGALRLACKHGHERCARTLLGAGVPPDHGSPGNKHPAVLAIEGGHAGCLAALLDAGLDPSAAPAIENWRESRSSLLHWSTLCASSDCARLLASRGADMEAMAPDGRTALMWAASLVEGRPMCELLISLGARADAAGSDGLDAEGVARSYGREELAAFIREWARASSLVRELGQEIEPAPARPAGRRI